MDKTDLKILNILRENSRENASAIGEKVKMSVSAVIERIKKLENSGVIRKYTVVLDQKQLGRDVLAYILVGIDHPKYNEGFNEYVKSCPSIVSCHYMTGEDDYLLMVNTESTESLERVINNLKRVPGTSHTKTTVVLSTIKDDYSPSIDI